MSWFYCEIAQRMDKINRRRKALAKPRLHRCMFYEMCQRKDKGKYIWCEIRSYK